MDTWEAVTIPYLIFVPNGEVAVTQEYQKFLDDGWEPCGITEGPPVPTPQGPLPCIVGQLKRKKSPVLTASRLELGRFSL